MSAQKSIRTGFLGVSHPHAGGRANVMGRIPELELSGFFEPDSEVAASFSHHYGVHAFDSLDRFFDELNPELVVIEGRNPFNAQMAMEAARRKTPMLIEKPGAHDLETLRALAQEVERQSVFCQIGYHLRYSPAIAQARACLESNPLGRITTARFHASVMTPWLTDPWFCDPDDRGGLVYLDFCHMLDLLILFLGRPTESIGRIRKLEGVPEHIFEDSAAFLFEFGDVLAAGDCCGWEANDWIERWRLELYGMEGTLEIGMHPPLLKLYRQEAAGDVPAGWSTREHRGFDGEENYRLELKDIAERLMRDEAPGGATIQEALTVAEVLEDLYRQNEER
ncbi:MAG: Gfo/Idh/MocA family oxidoreductase [Planctomycetota bacterium]